MTTPEKISELEQEKVCAQDAMRDGAGTIEARLFVENCDREIAVLSNGQEVIAA